MTLQTSSQEPKEIGLKDNMICSKPSLQGLIANQNHDWSG